LNHRPDLGLLDFQLLHPAACLISLHAQSLRLSAVVFSTVLDFAHCRAQGLRRQPLTLGAQLRSKRPHALLAEQSTQVAPGVGRQLGVIAPPRPAVVDCTSPVVPVSPIVPPAGSDLPIRLRGRAGVRVQVLLGGRGNIDIPVPHWVGIPPRAKLPVCKSLAIRRRRSDTTPLHQWGRSKSGQSRRRHHPHGGV
jgi:hypothetical protein